MNEIKILNIARILSINAANINVTMPTQRIYIYMKIND